MSHTLCGVWLEPGLFVTYEYLQETLSSLSVQFKNNLDAYKYMEKADLGKHCLLLHNPGFPRWRHIYTHGQIHTITSNRSRYSFNNVMTYM